MKHQHLLAAMLVAMLLLGVGSPAHAVPSTVSFTARITTDDGTPVEGNVALVLRVYDDADAGTLLWEETQPSVPAADGLVYASLGSVDPVGNGLDATVFTGGTAYLELTVDGDVLAPRIPIESVPYAINAGRADVAATLEGFDPSTVQTRVTGTCAAGMYVTGVNENGTVVCGTDANAGGDITGVTAGAGLTGGGASGGVTLTVDTAVVQARVTGTCAAGMYVTGVNANGTVVCGTDANGGGDITGVTAGTGLTGGGTTGGVTLTVDTTTIQARVTGTCAAGMYVTGVNANGTVTCGTDANAGGDITGVTAGTGLTGGGTTGGVTLTVDTTAIQARVTGTCAAGMYVTGVNANGTVTCGTDANAGGDITGVTAGTGLTGGGATGGVTLTVDTTAIQARITGTCAAGMYVTGVNANGTVTCATDATGGGGDITGVTAGTGLTGGGATGSVTLTVDTTAIQARVTGTCAAGMYVTGVNANGTVTCGTDANAGGDITGVTAGTGMTGGGTTGAVTLGIANGGVDTAQIATGAVTMSKTSGPIGSMQMVNAVANATVPIYNATAPVVTMPDAGMCFVTTWAFHLSNSSFDMEPSMFSVSSNTNTFPGTLATSDIAGGAGTEVTSTASFAVTAGQYRFGCHVNNNVINASCRATWICN